MTLSDRFVESEKFFEIAAAIEIAVLHTGNKKAYLTSAYIGQAVHNILYILYASLILIYVYTLYVCQP